MTTKLYPFSMAREAHNIELVKDVTYMSSDPKDMEIREKCIYILMKMMDSSYDGKVAHLTGKDYGIAKELSLMGQIHRDVKNS